MPRVMIKDPLQRLPDSWGPTLDQAIAQYGSDSKYGILLWPDFRDDLSPEELSREWILIMTDENLDWPKDIPHVLRAKSFPCSLRWLKEQLTRRAAYHEKLYAPIQGQLIKEQERLLFQMKSRLTHQTQVRREELERSQEKLRKAQEKLIRLNALISSLSQATSEEELNTLLTEQIPHLISSSGPLNIEDESILDQIREVTSLIFHHKSQLRKAETLSGEWTQTFNSIDDPVVVLDAQLHPIRSNQAYQENQLSEHLSEELLSRARKARTTNRIVSDEVFFDKLDRWYFVRWIPRKSLVVMYFSDITASRNIRQHILQAEKLTELGVLAGSVAHEINNPLAGIIAFIQLTKSSLGSNHSSFSDLREMEKAALQCRTIVQNLLGFSRKANLEECGLMSVHQIFETIAPLIQLQLKHEHIESVFHSTKESKNYFVYGSFNQYLQILLNLSTLCLENTRPHSPRLVFHWSTHAVGDGHYAIMLLPKENSASDVLPPQPRDQSLWNLCHYVTEELVRQNQGHLEPVEKGSRCGWQVVFPKATTARKDEPEVSVLS